MNKELQNALQLLTGKSDFDEVSLDELQKIAEAYPYFPAAQLLLTQKLRQSHDINLQEQLFKTALFFPNQQWLQYLLSVTENAGTPVVADAKQNEVHNEVHNNENSLTKGIIFSEHPNTPAKESPTETEDANLITLPAERILNGIPDNESITSEPEESPLDDEELQQQSEPLPIEESSQKISSLLSEQAEQFSKPVEEKTEVAITTEPFHAVDYFASQGIRLDAKREENHIDKKVHKFTDWLRQMKRINPHPVDLGTEAEEETFVAKIADSSNYTKEVLTESMANVLLKQGKPTKAVEIYQKLSLLNPDKSTYFAALIQNIK